MNDFYLNPENIKKQTEEMKLNYLYKVMQSHTGDMIPLYLKNRLSQLSAEIFHYRYQAELCSEEKGYRIYKRKISPYLKDECVKYSIEPIMITIYFMVEDLFNSFEYAIEGAEATAALFFLKNYTPHPITLINENGEPKTIESSGIARVEQLHKETGLYYCDIPIKKTEYLKPLGLPAPEKDTLYIVSQIVAQAAKNRYDLVFPGDFVRDSAGKIIGCKSLLKY